MAPVVLALKARPREFDARVAVTAQHRQLLDQVLKLFRIKSDHDLKIMRDGQTLTDVSVLALQRLEPVMKQERPDLVLVHGDTTTTLIATLAAYYQKISVGHVEAGLRSFDAHNPFPEEINRRLADAVCVLHFAPTATAKRNLLREGISPEGIFVTGNTGIDALKLGLARLRGGDGSRVIGVGKTALPSPKTDDPRPFILVTAHRRENFGKPLADVFLAIRDVARARPGVRFVYPVHPNPNVTTAVDRILGKLPNVKLLPPLDYAQMLPLLRDALFVVTDSGGLQEEAPSLGKPVLVLRKVTERPEAVAAGTVKIVGTEYDNVRRWMTRLIQGGPLFLKMANAVNPYGDGQAADRTIEALRYYFGSRNNRPTEFAPRRGRG